MLFNSYSLLFVFLPVTLLVFMAIRRRSLNATIGWLALASFVFYRFTGPQFTLLLESLAHPTLWISAYHEGSGDKLASMRISALIWMPR